MTGEPLFGMTSVAAALTVARQRLEAAGIENPRLEGQLLLAWTLGGRREDLAREPERLLSGREAIIFDKAVALRAQRRPLSYITGERGFFGRDFKINRAVLIPRWETELLVQRTLHRIASAPSPILADIGTGSACIAVTLACERSDATVFATDISPLALRLARKNVERYSVGERVLLREGDLLAPLSPGMRLDAIVSNPPYVSTADLPTLEPEVRDYEPEWALSGVAGVAGTSGTGIYPLLIAGSAERLKDAGWLLMEVGAGQAESVLEMVRAAGFVEECVSTDSAGIARVVEARMPSGHPTAV